jgi:hypothetical protein
LIIVRSSVTELSNNIIQKDMGVSSANRASSSNHFPPNSALTLVNPVTFPPGRAKFVDEPVGYFALIFF